ncbi:MAG: MBL fold metallo-hydrolase [Chlamydiae bacterium]|nr:MBL fold metallo-hydrolase [Chlamydiota bacterium]
MIGFCPLASGSKGNAIFVGTKNVRLLIDAGLSLTQLSERLQEINIDLSTIQAVLITHEHSDHIRGLKTLSERLNVPILTNAETAKGIFAAFGAKFRFKIFTTGEPFVFGDLKIHPFSVPHDTLDPVAFTMEVDGIKVGFCTDLGHVTQMVRVHLQKCDYLYLESNHQPSMVHSSARPERLKERILGKQGHLSNEECGQLIASVWHEGLRHVHLAHLSSECNTPEVALEKVKQVLESRSIEVPLSIAHQHGVSRVILFDSSLAI